MKKVRGPMKEIRKIVVLKESVRRLTPSELADVRGGVSTNPTGLDDACSGGNSRDRGSCTT